MPTGRWLRNAKRGIDVDARDGQMGGVTGVGPPRWHMSASWPAPKSHHRLKCRTPGRLLTWEQDISTRAGSNSTISHTEACLRLHPISIESITAVAVMKRYCHPARLLSSVRSLQRVVKNTPSRTHDVPRFQGVGLCRSISRFIFASRDPKPRHLLATGEALPSRCACKLSP